MHKNIILHDEQPILPPTAVHVCERIWSHAYYDSKEIDKAFTWSIPLALACTTVIAGVTVDTGTSQEVLQNSITGGFSLVSAYLARTIYEARKKLDFMRQNFVRASENFNNMMMYLQIG